MKAIRGGDEMIMDASERPFDVAVAHFDEALFFTELSVDEPTITTNP